MSEKLRLDVAVFERGLAETREKAKALIMAGSVYVNGQKALKAGATVRTEPFDLVLGSEPPCPIRIAFVFGINGEVLEFFHER